MVVVGGSRELGLRVMESVRRLVHRGEARRLCPRASADGLQAQQLHIFCASTQHLRASLSTVHAAGIVFGHVW